jgi:hypothetical protein
MCFVMHTKNITASKSRWDYAEYPVVFNCHLYQALLAMDDAFAKKKTGNTMFTPFSNPDQLNMLKKFTKPKHFEQHSRNKLDLAAAILVTATLPETLFTGIFDDPEKVKKITWLQNKHVLDYRFRDTDKDVDLTYGHLNCFYVQGISLSNMFFLQCLTNKDISEQEQHGILTLDKYAGVVSAKAKSIATSARGATLMVLFNGRLRSKMQAPDKFSQRYEELHNKYITIEKEGGDEKKQQTEAPDLVWTDYILFDVYPSVPALTVLNCVSADWNTEVWKRMIRCISVYALQWCVETIEFSPSIKKTDLDLLGQLLEKGYTIAEGVLKIPTEMLKKEEMKKRETHQ